MFFWKVLRTALDWHRDKGRKMISIMIIHVVPQYDYAYMILRLPKDLSLESLLSCRELRIEMDTQS